ncbi:MAG: flagellar biosynthesis protein FlhF [Deltaproteobacteria bacterium]|nr:flagellar biosynthesis protein FlhF [Deltaproteobacteria bacterium]MBZ0219279.1 flagellar biosynthesis protein FlhF [Deltaproteobacteria bacterium]
MRIKRFTGVTVREAMKSVKEEFGENALILGTKRLGAGRHEVVAAVDYDLSSPVSLDMEKEDVSAGPGKAPAGGNLSSPDGGSDLLGEELRKELRELKELKRLCMAVVSKSENPVSDVFRRLEENLAANGIDRRLAKKILLNTLSGVTKEKASDIAYLKSCIRERVYERLSVADPLSKKGVVAFVGPSGVGKTTTIAKLAALNALKKKRSMALVTMDTYRIAAAEQLRIYGKLMGVPVDVARDPGELKALLCVHRDKELVLVDTAGRSQKDQARMKELHELTSASPSIRFNLVLNSQTRDEAMYDAVKGFSALPIDSLSFTRLDEGEAHGPILNAMMLARKPVAYLSTGSRVPEDLEPASRENLVKFIMPN